MLPNTCKYDIVGMRGEKVTHICGVVAGGANKTGCNSWREKCIIYAPCISLAQIF